MTLESIGMQVDEAGDGEEAVARVERELKSRAPYQAVFMDVNMPRMDGLTALSKIKELSPETFCLVLTAYSNIKDAVLAIKHGAYDYLEKPVDSGRILEILAEANKASDLVKAAAFSAPSLQFDEGRSMIGGSSSIKKVFDIINKLAKVDTSVLIRGESGTGKELVARAVHYNSHRKKGPFVAVNCAAIPENLIESELFGHERGAFTGADRKKIGKFQFAEGGTIFLDEIGDISQQMQVKLLRVLQEKQVTPVGANSETAIDVRIVAATNKPLEEMIAQEKFRADLFYRLNVLPIVLPPLRDRREDIAMLIELQIKKFNKTHGRDIRGIEKGALNSLRVYGWPGNIRELENVIEHAFIVESGQVITESSLPEHLQQRGEKLAQSLAAGAGATGRPSASDDARVGRQGQSVAGGASALESAGKPVNGGRGAAGQRVARTHGQPSVSQPQSGGYSGQGIPVQQVSDLNYPILKEQFERDFLIKALRTFDGRVNQTAAHTKMTKVTLLRKLEKYGINPKEFIPPRV